MTRAGLLALMLAADGGGGTPCERLAESRQMKPGHQELDVNSDGVADCVLKGCYGSNCACELYVMGKGAPRQVGKFTIGFIDEPVCIGGAPDGGYCRLSVGVMMIHGEDQKYWYTYIDGGYVQSGVGERIPGPAKFSPKRQ